MREANLLTNPAPRNDLINDNLSRIAHKADELEKAANLIKIVLEENPADELMWSTLGFINYMKEDFSGAIGCFFKAVECNPLNLNNWIDMGFAYRCREDIELSDFIFWNLNEIVIEFCSSFRKIDEATLKEITKMIKAPNKRKSFDGLVRMRKISGINNTRCCLFRK